MNIAFITLFWHNDIGGKTAYQSALRDPIKVGDLCTEYDLFMLFWHNLGNQELQSEFGQDLCFVIL